MLDCWTFQWDYTKKGLRMGAHHDCVLHELVLMLYSLAVFSGMIMGILTVSCFRNVWSYSDMHQHKELDGKVVLSVLLTNVDDGSSCATGTGKIANKLSHSQNEQ